MPKQPSRGDRWYAAVGEARVALQQLDDALSQLRDVQSEYSDWQDNLPENLANSALGEKLQAVVDLDLDNLLGDVEGTIDEAEGIDLPLGFGRD